MKKTLLFGVLAVLNAAIFTGGCGYHFGSLAHPQLESIAVAPVINDTLSFNASAVLRGLLTERVTTDGSLKLKNQKQADCILYARITDVSYKASDYGTDPFGDDTFLANEWRCTVKVEYSLIIPGRGKPLISNRVATGKSNFLNGPDMETARLNSMKQALFSAAKDIISNVTEGW
ncbi:MAG: hypothetical protein E7043_05655 [Lentisphaerae bacterium]|nr:hypothetical protein [Lentisphaerota bacterium]